MSLPSIRNPRRYPHVHHRSHLIMPHSDVHAEWNELKASTDGKLIGTIALRISLVSADIASRSIEITAAENVIARLYTAQATDSALLTSLTATKAALGRIRNSNNEEGVNGTEPLLIQKNSPNDLSLSDSDSYLECVYKCGGEGDNVQISVNEMKRAGWARDGSNVVANWWDSEDEDDWETSSEDEEIGDDWLVSSEDGGKEGADDMMMDGEVDSLGPDWTRP